MGSLYYGSDPEPIEMPDRLLAHVKVVIATKLRRGESFTLSWRHTTDAPAGRSTLWLHPAIPLRIVFDDAEPEVLDPRWLQELAVSASSTGGLSVSLEAEADAVRLPQAT
ncbi:hypothetical protein F6J84_12455 [Microbacterium caowuchunii]|uniref:DUF7882 family protein n=1 Tax=Microbacterium caowuchunii TaxID=2614638 RepID=UPI001249121B|nr:hypothetical protein [Microbacterium caowuchunii]QEW00832.1 hypothetical protein F6J84_12455 [Microbacterium caowuchunii]